MAWNYSGGVARATRKGYGQRMADRRAVPPPSGNGVWLRCAVAALVVVAGAGVAWWWFASSRARTDEEEIRRRDAPKTRRATNKGTKVTSDSSGVGRLRETSVTHSSSNVASSETSSAEADAEAAAAEEARQNKWKEKFAKHRSIFTNGSDQILGMIASAPPGRDMPPLPITKSIDRDFMNSLDTPIEILESDSDKVRAVKEAVLKLRAEILAIKESEGLSVYEILTQHQTLLRENTALRVEAQKDAAEIYKNGDVELAREYVDKVNEKLIKLGAEPIKMPGAENPELRQHIREKLESIRNRKNPQGRR